MIRATAQKAACHPACWASRVPAGTPMMVATLSPETTTDRARPRLVASTSETAATEATAQNLAYAMADTTRMTSRNPKFGTSAAATGGGDEGELEADQRGAASSEWPDPAGALR